MAESSNHWSDAERESRLYSAQWDVDWQRQYVIDQFRELDRREAHLKALQARCKP